MKRLPFFILTALLLFASNGFAQQFNYNAQCQKAYQAIFKLED
jgi:hypothetical protein